MSYSIYFDFQENYEKFENITLHKIGKDLESEEFEQLEENLFPIYNYIHLLQARPSDNDILDIYENAPNITIIYIEEFEKYFITLNACGMDFTDSIAYAYMVIDGQIPKSLIPSQRLTLREENYSKLIKFINNEMEH